MKNLILCFLLFVSGLVVAQTPPARTWYFNDYGKKTTVKERWEEDGNGLKHGTYILYYTNGERKTLGHYVHGVREGKWIDENCYELFLSVICKVEIFNLKNGKADGEFTAFVKDNDMFEALITGGKSVSEYKGKYSEYGYYSNGDKIGKWEEGYDEEDKVYRLGSYSGNKRIGKWLNCKFDGNIYSTQKGYTTYFSDEGEFIKCLNADGLDIYEQSLFEKLNTVSDCESFLEKYPNSIYKSEIINIKEKFRQSENSEYLKVLLSEISKGKSPSDLSKFKNISPSTYETFLKVEKLLQWENIGEFTIKSEQVKPFINYISNSSKSSIEFSKVKDDISTNEGLKIVTTNDKKILVGDRLVIYKQYGCSVKIRKSDTYLDVIVYSKKEFLGRLGLTYYMDKLSYRSVNNDLEYLDYSDIINFPNEYPKDEIEKFCLIAMQYVFENSQLFEDSDLHQNVVLQLVQYSKELTKENQNEYLKMMAKGLISPNIRVKSQIVDFKVASDINAIIIFWLVSDKEAIKVVYDNTDQKQIVKNIEDFGEYYSLDNNTIKTIKSYLKAL